MYFIGLGQDAGDASFAYRVIPGAAGHDLIRGKGGLTWLPDFFLTYSGWVKVGT